MIEIIPDVVDFALIYSHTRRSSCDEIAPYLDEIRRELSHTYISVGDGPIEGRADDPLMRRATSYEARRERYWFVFPMPSTTAEAFAAAEESMGAVLVTFDGWVLPWSTG